jgi:hypothetical protein
MHAAPASNMHCRTTTTLLFMCLVTAFSDSAVSKCNTSYVSTLRHVVLAHWIKAQKLTAYATGGGDSLPIGKEQEHFVRHFNEFWSGYMRTPNISTAYVRIYKCGNKAIVNNMAAMNASTASDPLELERLKCVFTFVRHPIARWMSGYNEMEHRWIKNNKTYPSIDTVVPAANFSHFDLGTTERAAAFIFDLVQFKLMPPSTSDKSDIGLKRSWVYGEILHVFPMSGIFQHVSRLDFVGKLENFKSDWQEVVNRCNMLPLRKFDKALGQHASSQDSCGTYAAVRKLLSQSCILQCILFHVLIVDFICFQYPAPACGCHM